MAQEHEEKLEASLGQTRPFEAQRLSTESADPIEGPPAIETDKPEAEMDTGDWAPEAAAQRPQAQRPRPARITPVRSFVQTSFEELGSDVVVKPIFGSEGRGIVRVSDPDMAYRVFRAHELSGFVFYLQEFVPHGQRDLRAFVIGGKVEAAMERVGRGWRTNVSQGAQGQPVELDEELTTMALRAARVVGADYAGVDILPLEVGGHVVIEVNGIPGWRGLKKATGLNMADRLVDYVLGERG